MFDPPITEDDIASAERLLGVAYTAPERAQMVDNLDEQLTSSAARRALVLDNSAPMACRLEPRLPGFAMPHGADELLRDPPADPPLPDDAEDIAYAPLTRLFGWTASGALKSRRLTEIYLARIEALNPRLECFVTVTAERALAEADAADLLWQDEGAWPNTFRKARFLSAVEHVQLDRFRYRVMPELDV